MAKQAAKKEVGKIRHFFDKVSVAVVDLTGTLKVGDVVNIKGMTTDFVQEVDSMQIEHEAREIAKAGEAIGMKVKEKVRPGDIVYLEKKQTEYLST